MARRKTDGYLLYLIAANILALLSCAWSLYEFNSVVSRIKRVVRDYENGGIHDA